MNYSTQQYGCSCNYKNKGHCRLDSSIYPAKENKLYFISSKFRIPD